MSLTIINAGLIITVQDLGLPGLRSFGVPLGGAFDRESHTLANALVGNEPNSPTLELTTLGGGFLCREPLALGFAGASTLIEIIGPNYRRFTSPCSFSLKPGERLLLGPAKLGVRGYLAVSGGWLSPKPGETRLGSGTELFACKNFIPQRRLDLPLRVSTILRVMDGPDGSIDWTGLAYRIEPNSNRMGLRLSGPTLDFPTNPNRLSTPVLPGTVQLAGGKPLILGVASGTMGGYPHVAQVISADLDLLGRLGPGTKLTFQKVTLQEARTVASTNRVYADKIANWVRLAARDGLIRL